MKEPLMLLFCTDCTWEIIPMLLGAFVLAFLFWKMLYSKKHREKELKYEQSVEQLRAQMQDQSQQLEAEHYKFKKLTQKYMGLEKNFESQKLQLERLQEKLGE